MADTIDKIKPISSTTKASILRKTAYALPLRPSESGMSAEDIKKAFYSGMTDKEDSIMAELERVISEANIILQTIKDKQSINLGVDNANKALVTDSQGDITTANIDKTPTSNSENLVTSGGVHDYPAITFAERERLKSKNLFDLNYNGIFASNSEISISKYISMRMTYSNITFGIATNLPQYTFTRGNVGDIYTHIIFTNLKPNTKYTLSFVPMSVSTENTNVHFLGVYNVNTKINTKVTKVITTDDNGRYDTNYGIYIESRSTSFVVKDIQLEEGEASTDYVPFSGGDISHTGDREIEFAQKQYEKSKNLFDYTQLTTLSGVKSNGDGTFDVSSTFYYPSAKFYVSLDTGKTYTYSIDVNSHSDFSNTAIELVLFYKNNGNRTFTKAVGTLGRYSMSFTPSADVDYIEVRFLRKSINDNTTLFTANVSNIMICEGDSVKFQDYYGMPTYSNDSAVKFAKSAYEKSKNLYNATTAQTTDGHSITYSADTSELKINGAYEDGVRCMFNTWSLKKGTYTLCIGFASGSMTRFSAIKFNLYKGTSWTQYATCPEISSSKKQVYVTFTLTEDVYDVTLGLYENLSTNTMTNCVFNYQIVKGSIPDFNFQPYQGGEFVQENTLKQVELVYGTNIENLNSSSMTTLSEYYNYIVANPQKTFVCGVGNLETSNLKTLLGNPTGFANYTNCYIRNIGGSTNRQTYQIIEVVAIGLYVNKLAKGYIFYSDHTNKTVTWSGWTILK